jgi:DNA-binding beta-propeller fold protein YncE
MEASNIADCDDVLSVYDYGDPGNIQKLATLTAAQAGFAAADPGPGNRDPLFCDPTYQRGAPPAPHGCATSPVSGRAYCNLTSSGSIVVVDIDAATPTFQLLPTTGTGGGKTEVHPGGRYVYSLQEEPRGGCNIGQLVVVDSMSDRIVAQMPLGYTGPGCTDQLAGTPAETANPDHLTFSHDGKTLFVGVGGGFMVPGARVDQHLVLDLTDPAAPVQLPSIPMGLSTGHSSDALSGDGEQLFCVDSVDNTITQVDALRRAVVSTLPVGDQPKVVATYGSQEGPSEQNGPIE